MAEETGKARASSNEEETNRLKTERLSFAISDTEPRILRWHSHGCRPATDPEIELWNALTASESLLREWAEDYEAADADPCQMAADKLDTWARTTAFLKGKT